MDPLTMIPGFGNAFAGLVKAAFGAGEVGAWFRPDEVKGQFTTEIGETPISAVGDTIGLTIDRSLGAKVGPVLNSNPGGPFTSTTDWLNGSGSPTISVVNGRLRMTATSDGVPRVVSAAIPCVVSRFYEVAWSGNTLNDGGHCPLRFTSSSTGAGAGDVLGAPISESGRRIVAANASNMYLAMAKTMLTGQIAEVGSFTVRELPGYHAYMATASKRPLFARVPARGRVNILSNTENLHASSWTGPIAGALTDLGGGAWRLNGFDGATGERLRQRISAPALSTWTAQVQVRGEGSDIGKPFRVIAQRGITGTLVVATGDVTLTEDWQTVSATVTLLADNNDVDIRFVMVGGGPSAPIVRFPQQEPGPTATPYQRVGTGAFDVTEEGQPTLHGWLFDGIDDGLETNSIDMTGTNKVTVVAGYRGSLSSATWFLSEHSANSTTTDGTFGILAEVTGTTHFRTRGTSSRSGTITPSYPLGTVLAGEGDTDGNIANLRMDGVLVGTNSGVQGAVNYGNFKHFIGGRGAVSNYFPGYIFGYMFRGAASPLSLINKIEKFIGSRTGVGMDRNVVNIAAKVTPTNELWAYRVSANQVNFMLPFNGTQAYYYDIQNTGDDCMILRNMFRRLYTKPDPLTINTSTIESQVKSGSNVEVAIRLRKAGTSDTYRFIPQHESVNTCFLVSRVFRRNGVVLAANDAKYIPSRTFEIDSLYNCIHPEQVDPLARLRIIHFVTPQKVRAAVTIEFLRDCEIDVGYSIMNNTTLTPKRASVLRQDQQLIQTQSLGSDVSAPGQDKVTGCCMGQTTDNTSIVADWSDNLGAVMLGNQFNATALRQWFNGSGQKFYNTPFRSVTIPAGQSFSWAGEWRLTQWNPYP